ncbi:MAG: hypothetical protein HRT66_11510 [Flavobacteriaceae bacterium]|nr:hypothetical protein [Flavobacteriaceae bacterium]
MKIYSILAIFIALFSFISCSEDEIKSNLNSMESFAIENIDLTFSGNDITATVPFGTDISALIATIEISEGATVSPASGEAVSYTDGVVTFTVTAEDGTQLEYMVTITEVPASGLKTISAFTIEGLELTFDGNEITANVPFGTDSLTFAAAITSSANSTVSPASEVEVTYVDGEATVFTVTAQDGTEAEYNVTITVLGEETTTGTKLITYVYTSVYTGGSNEVETKTIKFTYGDNGFLATQASYGDYFGEEDVKTTTYTYDSDNNITKSVTVRSIGGAAATDLSSTVYVYEDGKMKSSDFVDVTDDWNTIAKAYTYDEVTGHLASSIPTYSDGYVGSTKLYNLNSDGNEVSYEEPYVGTIEITYDDKMNPYRNMYPETYIMAYLVSSNNEISKTYAVDTTISYLYNRSDYPISSGYTYYSEDFTITETFAYAAE